MLILAGDIGGTSARLGLFELAGGVPRPRATETFSSSKYADFYEILSAFTGNIREQPDAAAFAMPGPVEGGVVRTTNLPWSVDAAQLARQLNLEHAGLLNDLEAVGHSLSVLQPEDLAVLNAGKPGEKGNIAIVSAGTGLGEAGCYWDGERHHPFACEGGHTDFAPADDLQMELFTWLRGRVEHVSFERLISGPGLAAIHRFLSDTGRYEEPAALNRELTENPDPARIVHAAAESASQRCAGSLRLFVSIYGAEAGNMALKILARGGVYLGGGIAPKILDYLKGPEFMRAFTAKGRMRPLLESMAVRVIVNDKAGLLGAACYAVGG